MKFQQLPFDQDLKRMTTIRRHPINENLVRIVVKGAPEYLIPLCSYTLDESMREVAMNQRLVDDLQNDCVGEMASEPLKVLGYAYKDVDL